MTRSTTQIGSGRALFVLPGGRFLNATKPLAIKETSMPDDHFQWWRNALAGVKQHTYDSEPMCGYFAVQDRSPGVTPGPRNRWPLIACAIFYQDGKLCAERAGKPVPVEWVWPYAASRPITYEAYQYWHANGSWKQKENAA